VFCSNPFEKNTCLCFLQPCWHVARLLQAGRVFSCFYGLSARFPREWARAPLGRGDLSPAKHQNHPKQTLYFQSSAAPTLRNFPVLGVPQLWPISDVGDCCCLIGWLSVISIWHSSKNTPDSHGLSGFNVSVSGFLLLRAPRAHALHQPTKA